MKIFLRPFLILFTVLIFSGCIRLSAGYWHKDADDEEVKSKSVALDTRDLVDPNRAKGSITT